jgi:SET domain-containing protein
MQAPERFVNSSDCPNTKTVGESDVALRAIEKGEELTSKYPLKYGPHGERL